MGIRFYCPNGHKLNVKEFQAGRRGICPYCGAKIQIPLQSTRPSTREELQAAAATGAAALAGQVLPGTPGAAPVAPLAVPGALGGAPSATDPAAMAPQGYQAVPSWPASGVPATSPTMPADVSPAAPAAGVYASAPIGPVGGSLQPGGAAPSEAAAYPSTNPSTVAAPASLYSSPAAIEPLAMAGMGPLPTGIAGAPAVDPYAALGPNPLGTAAVAATPIAARETVAAPASALPAGAVSAGLAPAAGLPAVGVVDPLIEAGAAVWYVRPAAGGQYGPAGPDAMRQWLVENRIAGDSLVWREGWRDWKTAAEVFPQLNPAAQISPFGSLGVEAGRGTTLGRGSKVVLPRRSNSALQLVLVVVLAVAVIVLGIVFYVVLTSDDGKPAPTGGTKPPAAAPSGTSRPPATAPAGSTRPPASGPSTPTAPGGPTAPASPSPAPPAPSGPAATPPAAPAGG